MSCGIIEDDNRYGEDKILAILQIQTDLSKKYSGE